MESDTHSPLSSREGRSPTKRSAFNPSLTNALALVFTSRGFDPQARSISFFSAFLTNAPALVFTSLGLDTQAGKKIPAGGFQPAGNYCTDNIIVSLQPAIKSIRAAELAAFLSL
jgi:hypothetical protein